MLGVDFDVLRAQVSMEHVLIQLNTAHLRIRVGPMPSAVPGCPKDQSLVN